MNHSTDENMDLDQQGEDSTPKPSTGILITQGMQITIPIGGINFETGTLALHVGLDMTSDWLQIAIEHLTLAETNNHDVHSALATHDEKQLNLALKKNS